MKKFLITYILPVLLISSVLVSCEKTFDEFLSRPQLEGQTTTEAYWVAIKEMDKLMNGSYAVTLGFSGNGFGQSVHLNSIVLGDFVAPYEPNYSQVSDVGGALGSRLYRRHNNIINWDDHTRILQYASNGENIINAIIEKISSGRYQNDPDMNVLGNILLGEAHALRAMINFEYTRYFGKQYHQTTFNEKAWLYRKKFIQSVHDAYKTRETVEDSYKLLIEDCDRAIELLPEQFNPAIHPATYGVNRVNKDFARALKAEILFQMNKFAESKAVIDELIGSVPGNPNRYPLEQYIPGNPTAGFPGQIYWRYQNEWYGPSKQQEVIFSFSSDAGTSPVRADRNQRWALFLPPVEDMNQSRAQFEFTGTRAVWRMSQHFIDYVSFDKTKDLRYRYLIDEVVATNNGRTYWWPLKFNMVSNGPTGPNILWYRSGQFMLMRAECNARLGNTTDAIADLNAIRNRAGLGNYLNSPDNTGNLVADIIKERARELFLEKYRIWELLRLGAIDGTPIGHGDRLTVPESNPGFDAIHTGTAPIPWNSDIWPFAIPSGESIYNPGVLN
jgi:starch-binding outer membrane protein, SusD/RagB family